MAVKGKACVDNKLSRRENRERLASFGTQDTGRRQKKTQHWKLKRCYVDKGSDGKYYLIIWWKEFELWNISDQTIEYWTISNCQIQEKYEVRE